jgi:hypothetical protein
MRQLSGWSDEVTREHGDLLSSAAALLPLVFQLSVHPDLAL